MPTAQQESDSRRQTSLLASKSRFESLSKVELAAVKPVDALMRMLSCAISCQTTSLMAALGWRARARNSRLRLHRGPKLCHVSLLSLAVLTSSIYTRSHTLTSASLCFLALSFSIYLSVCLSISVYVCLVAPILSLSVSSNACLCSLACSSRHQPRPC